MSARDHVLQAPFWTAPPQTEPLFRCALGTGHVLWIRAGSSTLALKAAISELEDLVPDLNFTTVIVSRERTCP